MKILRSICFQFYKHLQFAYNIFYISYLPDTFLNSSVVLLALLLLSFWPISLRKGSRLETMAGLENNRTFKVNQNKVLKTLTVRIDYICWFYLVSFLESKDSKLLPSVATKKFKENHSPYKIILKWRLFNNIARWKQGINLPFDVVKINFLVLSVSALSKI